MVFMENMVKMVIFQKKKKNFIGFVANAKTNSCAKIIENDQILRKPERINQ
jgi:hypothetical protein